jgi:hypothetical protein
MKATARVHENAMLAQLAAQVCLTALDELKGKDPVKALDALMWLTGRDFPLWAEAAGVPFADPLLLLTTGKAKAIRTKRVRVKHEQFNLATV